MGQCVMHNGSFQEDWIAQTGASNIDDIIAVVNSLPRNAALQKHRSVSCDPIMFKSLKSKLKLPNLRRRNKDNKTKDGNIIAVHEAPTTSTNPFDDVDEEETDAQLQLAVAHRQRECKRRLLERLHPYCYSDHPTATRRSYPTITARESAVSILTRSHEINNPHKQRIVRAHLLAESEPTKFHTRRCWSQADLNTIAGGGAFCATPPSRNVFKHRMLSGMKTNRRKFSESASNLFRLSGRREARPTGATADYCPSGFYNGVSVLRPPPARPDSSSKFLARWSQWTLNMRRRNRRVNCSGS